MPYYRCPACLATSYSAAAHSSMRTCPSCGAPLAEASELAVVPGSNHSLSRTLRAQPQAAGEARRAVATLALPAPTRESLSLIVSELVTNSILHAGLSAGDTLAVHVENGGDHVRLAVHDGGPGFTPPGANPDAAVVGGNGLVLAAELSDCWGVDCDENGCTVWCDIATEEKPPAAVDRGRTASPAAELALEVSTADRGAQLEWSSPPMRMNASCPQ
jgi:anti-sigma regulatory factor (Ser/Thr protein kinase)